MSEEIEKHGESNQVQFTKPVGDKFMTHEFVEEADTDKLQLMGCPSCGHMHFRHAGYVLPLTPYVEKGESKMMTEQVPVYICIKCKTSLTAIGGKLHNMSKVVDVASWEKTEVEAHKKTGPGSQC